MDIAELEESLTQSVTGGCFGAGPSRRLCHRAAADPQRDRLLRRTRDRALVPAQDALNEACADLDALGDWPLMTGRQKEIVHATAVHLRKAGGQPAIGKQRPDVRTWHEVMADASGSLIALRGAQVADNLVMEPRLGAVCLRVGVLLEDHLDDRLAGYAAVA